MMKTLSMAVLVLSSALLAAGCSPGSSVSFRKQVQPLLTKNCAECHVGQGEGAQKSGFHVDSYNSVMKGTKLGPMVIAGDSASSSLYRLVAGQVDKSIRMPHGRNPLPAADIALIEQWIDQGAKDN